MPIKTVNLYLDISSKGVDSRSPKKWETREFQGQYVKVGRRISSQRDIWDQKAGHWGDGSRLGRINATLGIYFISSLSS